MDLLNFHANQDVNEMLEEEHQCLDWLALEASHTQRWFSRGL